MEYESKPWYIRFKRRVVWQSVYFFWFLWQVAWWTLKGMPTFPDDVFCRTKWMTVCHLWTVKTSRWCHAVGWSFTIEEVLSRLDKKRGVT